MPDTISALIEQYRNDPQSSFAKLSYAVRIKHGRLLARIIREHGQVTLSGLRTRDLVIWHQAWLGKSKIAIAHALITRLRVAFRFGATILEDRECRRLAKALAEMRFEKPPSRNQPMSAEQAKAIRVKAHVWFGWRSIAMVQALQFELRLNQKAVIGEWVPVGEVGASTVRRYAGMNEEKWVNGLQWSDVNENLILQYGIKAGRREFDLKKSKMVMEELALAFAIPIAKLSRSHLPHSGPMILNDITGLPYSTAEFRRKWRLVADEAGVPKSITNRDSGKLVIGSR